MKTSALRKVTLWHLMTLTAAIAGAFALLPLVPAACFSSSILLFGLSPYPVRWVTFELVATAVLLIWGLAASDGIGDGMGDLFVLLAWSLLALCWAVRMCFLCCLGWPQESLRTAWIVPAAALVLLVTTSYDVMLRLELEVSKTDLLADARQIARNSNQVSFGPRHLGVFRVIRAEERSGCVLWTTGGYFYHEVGIAYYPSRTPPTLKRVSFRHIKGPWWRFDYSW